MQFPGPLPSPRLGPPRPVRRRSYRPAAPGPPCLSKKDVSLFIILDAQYWTVVGWTIGLPTPWRIAREHERQIKSYFIPSPAKMLSLFLPCSPALSFPLFLRRKLVHQSSPASIFLLECCCRCCCRWCRCCCPSSPRPFALSLSFPRFPAEPSARVPHHSAVPPVPPPPAPSHPSP